MLIAVEQQAGTLAGTVHISARQMVSKYLLVPVLRSLRQAHPEIETELVPSDDPADRLQREADIALRMFGPHGPAPVARRLAELPVGICAHRDYLECHGPVTLDTLARHHWIGPNQGEQMRQGFARIGHPVDVVFCHPQR